jgi:aquaporin Z
MLAPYLAEFVGTFVFLLVILMSPSAINIGIALAAVILAFGSISGGNFNPAVSLMLFAKGDLKSHVAIGYVIAQCLGGLTALQVKNFV